ncbi:hypothetical protein Q8A73_010439 [Channa argus]|nr:hypothetical protein Q8A73_010439 [Channa argus]
MWNDVISTLSDVQLGASTIVRRVLARSGNLADQLDQDLVKCRWFGIQCDESVDSSSTAQLMVFIRMVFDDFSTKEELLTLLPLKTTTKGVDIYNAVKDFFVGKKQSDGSAGDEFCLVFCPFWVRSKSSCSPKARTLDLAFLTDITGKLNHLNCEAKMVPKDNAYASETFDKVAEKYFKIINRLGQEFENRFCDLDQVEPSLSDMNFIRNKHRARLTDAHLQDSLRVAVSSYTPDYSTLVNSMQCQASHQQTRNQIPDVLIGNMAVPR